MDFVGGLWDGAVKGVQDAGKGVQGFSEQALQATGDGLKGVGEGLSRAGNTVAPQGELAIGFVKIRTQGNTRAQAGEDGTRVSAESGRTYHFNKGDAVAQGRLKAAPAQSEGVHVGFVNVRTGVKTRDAAQIELEHSPAYLKKQKEIAQARKELAKRDQDLQNKFNKLL